MGRRSCYCTDSAGAGRYFSRDSRAEPALAHLRARPARHGKSSHVARGYRGPQYAEDIACLLRERVSGPAVLFGHSLGGMLAMWVASHHPELVRALILGDNIIVVRRLHNPMYTALFSGLRDLARKGGSVEQIADGIGKIVLPVPNTDESVMIHELPGNDEAYLLSWARCVQQADADTYDMTLDGSSLEGWDGETVLTRNRLSGRCFCRAPRN